MIKILIVTDTIKYPFYPISNFKCNKESYFIAENTIIKNIFDFCNYINYRNSCNYNFNCNYEIDWDLMAVILNLKPVENVETFSYQDNFNNVLFENSDGIFKIKKLIAINN